MTMRWWGWGSDDQGFDISTRPRFWPWLQDRLASPELPAQAPVERDAIGCRPVRLPEQVLARIAEVVGEVNLSTQAGDRLTHTHGKGYVDLIEARAGRFEAPPDAVVFPATAQQVAALLGLAAREGFGVVPFGGGTSVTGGLAPRGFEPSRPWVSLDLGRLDGVLEIDGQACIARVQAGILGPKLEEALAGAGFTLGHFPQSFEFSSLGGWIATRSSGQKSTRYGGITDLTIGLEIATAEGLVRLDDGPEGCLGPDWRQLLVGSEGTLAVITEATVRLRKRPERQVHRAMVFPDWERGLQAVRELMQGDRRPAVVRLSDAVETEAFMHLRESQGDGRPGLLQRLVAWYLARFRGIHRQAGCLLVLGFEGRHEEVERDLHGARHLCESLRAFDLGPGVGDAWHRGRFSLPYLRDHLLDRGVFVETFETGVPWTRLPDVDAAVRAAVARAVGADGLVPVLLCHVSHPTAQGACLYYTLLARQLEADAVGQFKRYKAAVTDAILEAGGSLSHHHGVGQLHAPWLARSTGAQTTRLWGVLKAAFDPGGVLPAPPT
jgi:alkyldihydroxyacetonephosphate synthase